MSCAVLVRASCVDDAVDRREVTGLQIVSGGELKAAETERESGGQLRCHVVLLDGTGVVKQSRKAFPGNAEM